MRCLGWELKKIFSMPMLWIFLAGCILVNGWMAGSGASQAERERLVYRQAVQEKNGGQMGPDFWESLAKEPPSALREQLLEETTGAENTLADLDTAELARLYLGLYQPGGGLAGLLEKKYAALQDAVDALGGEGAALSVYAARDTDRQFQRLYDGLHAALTESAFLALLLGIYTMGMERLCRTDSLLLSAKRGRKTALEKGAAAWIAAAGSYLLFIGFFLAAYGIFWEGTFFWNANVASQFHTVQEAVFTKPFLTWGSFTLGEYFAAQMGLSLGLLLVFSLMGSAAGLWLKNSYIAFLAVFAFLFAQFAAPMLLSDAGCWNGYIAATFFPAVLWHTQPLWFTDGGISTVVPWQESWGICLNLVLWAGIFLLAYRRFRRKDVA